MKIRNLYPKKAETAFVLGGGGNLGAIQVGQLRALLEHNITPDLVVGCSVGALNGAAIAGSPTLAEVDRLAELWTSLQRTDIFPGRRAPWRFIRQGLSAYPDHGLRSVIDRWLRYRNFEETRIPFWVNATSLRTGREQWFNEGDITRPLLASTALPGVFPTVDIDGEDYMDGGVVNNVPVSKAFELGAKKVYVLDANHERERRQPKRPYEVLMQAVSIARSYRFRIERDAAPEGAEMVFLPTLDAGKLRFDDFKRSAQLIESAYRLTSDFLDSSVPSVAASA